MINRLRVILAVGLMLAAGFVAGPAFALGLGQIEIKSQRGQPLLAEIPIISSDPSELENLQARLASPDTFARIGLEPPQGIVSNLQFAVALSARGEPVIRVTSQQPLDQPLLTFLLEIDWDRGRLVREYSVLVDAPRTVSAPAQPPIQAPTAAPSNAIVREPEAPLAAPGQNPEQAATDAAEATAAETGAATPPATVANEAAPPSDAIPTSAPPAPPASAPTAQPIAAGAGAPDAVTVQAGDTLGEIARSLDSDGNLDQTMLALLRANPEAFIGGNINLVKRGAVLRVPPPDAQSQYTTAEARAIVHEQIVQWRDMRKPALQPAAIAGADVGATGSQAATSTNTAARVADARLEITPPSASGGRQAGTRSGIQAGGEGDMLRQELQQTKETLAARDSEVQELKARVTELEKLQQDQQQLITLKDSKLAQAQQNLATSGAQAATTAQAQPATATTPQMLLWPWIVGALVIVLLLAWLFMRRRPGTPVRPVFDTSALAASIPDNVGAGGAADMDAVDASDVDADTDAHAHVDTHTDSDSDTGTHADVDGRFVPDAALVDTGSSDAQVASTLSTAAREADVATPPWHSRDGRAATADAIAPLNPAPAGHERLELARAYIDLGDVDTARSLLQEVADGGDAAARGEAARLLRELV